jgi:hypothetical protein
MSRELMDDMAIWYHRFSGGDRTLFNANKNTVKCIKEKHKICLQCERVIEEGRGSTSYVQSGLPVCSMSDNKAENQVHTPHLCYAKAQELLDSLQNKWDLRGMQPEDYEEYQAPEARED